MSLLLKFDQEIFKSSESLVALDEAGRGAFAGPLMVGLVYVKRSFCQFALQNIKTIKQINDSKKLTPSLRQNLFEQIKIWHSTGELMYLHETASVEEIETCNVVGATRNAMGRAISKLLSLLPKNTLPLEPSFTKGLDLWDTSSAKYSTSSASLQIILDGLPLKPFPYPHTAFVKGDGKSLAIAMASIVAKVTRDAYMTQISSQFPLYAFEQNKGYGTQKHRELIALKGPSKLHRKQFIKNCYPPTAGPLLKQMSFKG